MVGPRKQIVEGAKKIKEKIIADWRNILGKSHEGEKPTYWGTWKGWVIRVLAEYGPLPWGTIRDITGLSRQTLNDVLQELSDAKEITKQPNETYTLRAELNREYQQFLKIHTQPLEEEPQEEIEKPVQGIFKEEQQDELIAWIKKWIHLLKLQFDMNAEHFYLTGSKLDQLSKNLIDLAKTEVIVVNPFVQDCDLSDTIRFSAQKGKNVTLITRPPELDRVEVYKTAKMKCHNRLQKAGVNLIKNDRVHAKIILIDRRIALITSMNFIPTSTGGQSWEAGLVTFNRTAVDDINLSISNLMNEEELSETPSTKLRQTKLS